ncbi:MAG: hypothetical protein Phyf2KO_15900 [Phycisphaerales bacterium]
MHALGFDTEHGAVRESGLDLVVSTQEERMLAELGVPFERVRVGRPLKDQLDDLNGEIPGGYDDWAGIQAHMHAAAARNPAICEVVDLTDRYGTPATHEGRHIIGVRISENVGMEETEPAMLIVAAHHSREIGTPVAALRAIDNLVDGYGVNTQVTQAIDQNEIWIVPLWNPDGYEHVYNVDDFWRKNRRNNGDGTIGVDLNRNYPVGWAACGGSQKTWSEIYEGPSPASEPETQTMLAFASDRRFAKVADVHSYASEVRYGYGCWDHPWDPHFGSIAADLSTLSGYQGATRSSCCLGGDIHMHTNTNGSLSFLWEIGTTFHPTYASAQAEADVLWNAFLELISSPIAVSGQVTNSISGAPVEATVEFLTLPFANGETHRSAPRHGLYHAHPPAGSYSVRFQAEGFAAQDHTVVVNSTGDAVVLDIALVPNCAADVNGDGALTPTDFTAWIDAFNNNTAGCDQNNDGMCRPTDFTAWIDNFNAGC